MADAAAGPDPRRNRCVSLRPYRSSLAPFARPIDLAQLTMPDVPRPKLVTFQLPPNDGTRNDDDRHPHSTTSPATTTSSSSNSSFSPHYSSFPFAHPTTPLMSRRLSFSGIGRSPSRSPLLRTSFSAPSTPSSSRGFFRTVTASSAEGIRRASRRLSWAPGGPTSYDDEYESFARQPTTPVEPPSANGVRVWYGSYTRCVADAESR